MVTGTHQGEYMGVAPTGKSVTYNEMFIFRFAHGRVVETWGVVDVYLADEADRRDSGLAHAGCRLTGMPE